MKEENNNRTITISFKVTRDDAEIIEEFATKRSISRSELVYRTLFKNIDQEEKIRQLQARIQELEKENETLNSIYPFMRSKQ